MYLWDTVHRGTSRPSGLEFRCHSRKVVPPSSRLSPSLPNNGGPRGYETYERDLPLSYRKGTLYWARGESNNRYLSPVEYKESPQQFPTTTGSHFRGTIELIVCRTGHD